MMQKDRERMATAMLGCAAGMRAEDKKELEEMIQKDVESVEGIVDELVSEAFRAGKRFGMLKAGGMRCP